MFRAVIVAGGLIATSSPVLATSFIPYPTPGFVSTTSNIFVMPVTGDVTVTFLFKEAGFNSRLGLFDGANNQIGGWVLPNQTTVPNSSVTFSNVSVGTDLVWKLQVLNTGNIFSVRSPQAWSTQLSTNPASWQVNFEDIKLPGGDKDYNDYIFKFSLPTIPSIVVPEPKTWTLLVAGFGVLGLSLRRKRVQAKNVFT